jgi:hypothetical protein
MQDPGYHSCKESVIEHPLSRFRPEGRLGYSPL